MRWSHPKERVVWIQCGILVALCVLVVGVYGLIAREGCILSSSLNPANSYYNLLVQGFRAGQLNLENRRSARAGAARGTPMDRRLILLIP